MNKSLVICGIDEAGRGALAGSLVAAAVIHPASSAINKKVRIMHLKDGKLLSPVKRKQIVSRIKSLGLQIVIEEVSTLQINHHGIGWANKEIIRRLIRRIEADEYIVDGNMKLGRVRKKTQRIKSIVDADATIPAVIMAGIVAKVHRDATMKTLHKQFPKYKWNKNSGYGTKKHILAIKKYGTTRFHRGVFVTTALRNCE